MMATSGSHPSFIARGMSNSRLWLAKMRGTVFSARSTYRDIQ
jgi:hypothetical protein